MKKIAELIISEMDREYCYECKEDFENKPKFTIHPDCLTEIKEVNSGNKCPQCGIQCIASFKTCLKCNTGHIMVNYRSIIESRLERLKIRYSTFKLFYIFIGIFIGTVLMISMITPNVFIAEIFLFGCFVLYLKSLKRFKPERYDRLNNRFRNWIDKYWRQPMLFEIIEDLDENA